jgi:NTE family protein
VLTALLAALLAACTPREVPPERLPRFELPAAAPRVALVLGSGGHRGFAHLGVLRVLEAEGLRPDLVVGSSVGALVGALYASGMPMGELERLAMDLNLMDFFMEWRLLGGLPASGEGVEAFVSGALESRPIESLPIGFAAVATRARDRALVPFNRGDTALAVRASGASPGLFDAVRIGDETYVDGDEASPVPILAARRLGAKVVIAVDVSAHAHTTPDDVPGEWIEKDARRARQVRAEAAAADVLLHPDLGYYVNPQETGRRRAMALGEAAARRQLDDIRAAFERAGVGQAIGSARMPSGEASR